MSKSVFKTKELTMMALFAALLCISSYISIPLPFSVVSITAQTLVVNMIALLLPPKKAGITIGIWILLGFAGLPVFSGGMGGPAKLFGPTGGYIFSYLAAVIVISLLKGKKRQVWRMFLVTIAVGIPVIYAIGTPWMMALTGIDWKAAFTTSVLPFIPGDIVKCIVAVLISKTLEKIINLEEQ